MTTLTSVLAYTPVEFIGLPAGSTIGVRIAAARRAQGRSVSEVADAAKLSVNTVKGLEAGRGSLPTLLKLLQVIAPTASAKPLIDKPLRRWRTVHGKVNPDRPLSDHYSTPAPLVEMLFDHVEFDRRARVLEPCVGEFRVIEHVLQGRGFQNITCFDLHGRGSEERDFFAIQERFDVLVTNPPFNQHIAFIRHAKSVTREKIALLLPLTYLTGAARHAEIWSDKEFPLSAVLVFNRGIDFLTGDPFASRVQATQLYCAWFVFDRNHVGNASIQWIDNHSIVARRQHDINPG